MRDKKTLISTTAFTAFTDLSGTVSIYSWF